MFHICYPNTTELGSRTFRYEGVNCDKIEEIWKSGEMASIKWFKIIKDGKVVAEIKESVCDLYYKD